MSVSKQKSKIIIPTSLPLINGKTEEQFVQELKRLHETYKTPIHHLPRIFGKKVNLLGLYNAVITRGGFRKVNAESTWIEVIRDIGLSISCGNAPHAIRTLYQRHLEPYERVHRAAVQTGLCDSSGSTGGSTGDLSSDILAGMGSANVSNSATMGRTEEEIQSDSDSRRRGLRGPSLGPEAVANVYRAEWHVLPEHMRPKWHLSTDLASHEEYTAVERSLVSGLPNEIDVSLNSLLLMSQQPGGIQLNRNSRLLDAMLATVGIFDNDPGSYFELHSSWIKQGCRNFLRYWYEMIEVEEGRQYLNPDSLQTMEIDELMDPTGLSYDYELFNMRDDLKYSDREGHRIQVVATVLRNLVLEGRNNRRFVSQSSQSLRFLLLCSHACHSALRQVGLETLAQMRYPVIGPLKRVFSSLLVRCLLSDDRMERIRGLQIISQLSMTDTDDISNKVVAFQNSDFFVASLPAKCLDALFSLMALRDLHLVVSALDAVYALSTLGQDLCFRLAESRHALPMLTTLLTLEAQAMGAESLVGVRVMQGPMGNSSTPAPASGSGSLSASALMPPPPAPVTTSLVMTSSSISAPTSSPSKTGQAQDIGLNQGKHSPSSGKICPPPLTQVQKSTVAALIATGLTKPPQSKTQAAPIVQSNTGQVIHVISHQQNPTAQISYQPQQQPAIIQIPQHQLQQNTVSSANQTQMYTPVYQGQIKTQSDNAIPQQTILVQQPQLTCNTSVNTEQPTSFVPTNNITSQTVAQIMGQASSNNKLCSRNMPHFPAEPDSNAPKDRMEYTHYWLRKYYKECDHSSVPKVQIYFEYQKSYQRQFNAHATAALQAFDFHTTVKDVFSKVEQVKVQVPGGSVEIHYNNLKHVDDPEPAVSWSSIINSEKTQLLPALLQMEVGKQQQHLSSTKKPNNQPSSATIIASSTTGVSLGYQVTSSSSNTLVTTGANAMGPGGEMQRVVLAQSPQPGMTYIVQMPSDYTQQQQAVTNTIDSGMHQSPVISIAGGNYVVAGSPIVSMTTTPAQQQMQNVNTPVNIVNNNSVSSVTMETAQQQMNRKRKSTDQPMQIIDTTSGPTVAKLARPTLSNALESNPQKHQSVSEYGLVQNQPDKPMVVLSQDFDANHQTGQRRIVYTTALTQDGQEVIVPVSMATCHNPNSLLQNPVTSVTSGGSQPLGIVKMDDQAGVKNEVVESNVKILKEPTDSITMSDQEALIRKGLIYGSALTVDPVTGSLMAISKVNNESESGNPIQKPLQAPNCADSKANGTPSFQSQYVHVNGLSKAQTIPTIYQNGALESTTYSHDIKMKDGLKLEQREEDSTMSNHVLNGSHAVVNHQQSSPYFVVHHHPKFNGIENGNTIESKPVISQSHTLPVTNNVTTTPASLLTNCKTEAVISQTPQQQPVYIINQDSNIQAVGQTKQGGHIQAGQTNVVHQQQPQQHNIGISTNTSGQTATLHLMPSQQFMSNNSVTGNGNGSTVIPMTSSFNGQMVQVQVTPQQQVQLQQALLQAQFQHLQKQQQNPLSQQQQSQQIQVRLQSTSQQQQIQLQTNAQPQIQFQPGQQQPSHQQQIQMQSLQQQQQQQLSVVQQQSSTSLVGQSGGCVVQLNPGNQQLGPQGSQQPVQSNQPGRVTGVLQPRQQFVHQQQSQAQPMNLPLLVTNSTLPSTNNCIVTNSNQTNTSIPTPVSTATSTPPPIPPPRLQPKAIFLQGGGVPLPLSSAPKPKTPKKKKPKPKSTPSETSTMTPANTAPAKVDSSTVAVSVAFSSGGTVVVGPKGIVKGSSGGVLSICDLMTHYICEWAECRESFESTQKVYSHVYTAHFQPLKGEQAEKCLWNGCDSSIKRSLLSHLHDCHCSPSALQASLLARQQRLQEQQKLTAQLQLQQLQQQEKAAKQQRLLQQQQQAKSVTTSVSVASTVATVMSNGTIPSIQQQQTSVASTIPIPTPPVISQPAAVPQTQKVVYAIRQAPSPSPTSGTPPPPAQHQVSPQSATLPSYPLASAVLVDSTGSTGQQGQPTVVSVSQTVPVSSQVSIASTDSSADSQVVTVTSTTTKEGPVTKHIRLTAALTLRNMAQHCSSVRGYLLGQQSLLTEIAFSGVESSKIICECLAMLPNDGRNFILS